MIKDEELEFILGSKPIFRAYSDGRMLFACGKVAKDGGLTYFLPEHNAKIIIQYMSDEEWEEITNCDEEDEEVEEEGSKSKA